MTLSRLRLIAVPVALVVVACSDPTGTDSQLEVTLRVDRDTVRHHEIAAVSVSITNRGLEEKTIPGGSCMRIFEVFDSEGVVVGPEPYLCDMMARVLVLAPFETHVFHRSWSGLGFGYSPGESRPLPPGEYTLRSPPFAAGGLSQSEPVTVQVEEAAGVVP